VIEGDEDPDAGRGCISFTEITFGSNLERNKFVARIYGFIQSLSSRLPKTLSKLQADRHIVRRVYLEGPLVYGDQTTANDNTR
jgi:hypothetical protein